MATVSNLLLQVPSDHTEDVSATISRAPTPGFSDSESGDEGSVVSTAATSVVSLPDKEEPLPSRSSSQIAESILDVLQMFGQHLSADGIDSWTGRAMFFGSVHKRVEAGQPIKMVLPSFPWKSINRVHKGIGSLPDLAEELALSRLDHLCREIEKVYAGGAEVTIATDGLIFDDVVGITDDDTWSYGEALMDLCAEKCFSHIRLVRAMELLGYTSGQQLTKEKYFALAQKCREALLTKEFCRTEEYVRAMMKEDADTMSTYLGFIRFLETDLKYSPVAKDAASGHKYRKIVKKVAIGMVIRAESFTKLLQSKCAGYIRLSIHPSGGAVKLSVPLIPQADGAFPRSPWHCTIAVDVNGARRTVHVQDVRKIHTLVHCYGRPYYYREKSQLWDWEEDVPKRYAGPREKETEAEKRVLTKEQKESIEELARLQGPITLAGFANAADVRGVIVV